MESPLTFFNLLLLSAKHFYQDSGDVQGQLAAQLALRHRCHMLSSLPDTGWAPRRALPRRITACRGKQVRTNDSSFDLQEQIAIGCEVGVQGDQRTADGARIRADRSREDRWTGHAFPVESIECAVDLNQHDLQQRAAKRTVDDHTFQVEQA